MELSDISGIGKSRLEALSNAGILSCRNFADYFPKKYFNLTSPSPFVADGTYKMVLGTVTEQPKMVRAKRNFSILSAKMVDSFGNNFVAIWYNQPFVKNSLSVGLEYFVYGRDDKKRKNALVVSYYKSKSKSDGLSFFPVYKAIDNISSEIIRKAEEEVLTNNNFPSIIPENVEEIFELMNLNDAYKKVHFPNSLFELDEAKTRVNLEKLIPFVQISKLKNKYGRSERLHFYTQIQSVFDEYKKLLPFELTNSQTNAIFDIINDLKSDRNMNRMIEGDVGSGKTAVAFFAMYLAAKNGHQAAMMAPTEILAYEHYKLAKNIFDQDKHISVVFLSSSLSSAEKSKVIKKIASGEANIIIGSHSLFSKSVSYKNLKLAVVDEQHKFGVKARASLIENGLHLDSLTMSATPIPRSLALVFSGVLDISVLESRPHAQNVKTNIVSKSKIGDMWAFIQEKIDNGSKVFVVCPRIEDDDELEEEVSAKSVYDFLSTRLHAKVALVHGKIDREETDKLFTSFKDGDIQVLVSTTIVEVGVDAKDADIMVIIDSSRFGLASLHQLRGRVGRDGRESYCFCTINREISSKTAERLSFFKNNTSGFKIAEYDLASRGAGNLDGTEQHGIDSNEILGFSLESYEKAEQIVAYMIAHNLKIGESQYSIDETMQKLLSNIAMN